MIYGAVIKQNTCLQSIGEQTAKYLKIDAESGAKKAKCFLQSKCKGLGDILQKSAFLPKNLLLLFKAFNLWFKTYKYEKFILFLHFIACRLLFAVM